MHATFKMGCKYDASGRSIKENVIMECEYANWSPDCKTKDIYVLDGSSTDTWVLSEGTPVDTTDKELVEKVKKCLFC